MVFSPELSYQHLRRFPWLYRISTGENIDGGIAAFWPGMDEQMRFGDDYHSAYSAGVELVKGFPEDSGASFTCRRQQKTFEKAQVI